MQINEIREKIADTISAEPISLKPLAEKLAISKEDYKYFKIALKNLQKNNIISKKNGNYVFAKSYNIGYLQTFKVGESYIFYKNKKYAVKEDETGHSIHGDKVVFEILDKYLQTVKIVSTLKRKSTKVVGTYVEYNGIGFVVPDNEKINSDIYIQKNKVVPNMYDRVLVNIDEYKIFGKPEGRIEKKLFEDVDKEQSALERVIAKYGIQEEFPAEVIKKSMLLNVPVKKSMIDNRIDLREENIFTIDGITAKDFDDAISVRKINGGYELGVYIADVSYYVSENGTIDKCAFERGTSCYLDNYCIPMLPHSLSNGVCSLNEGEDKLVLGVKLIYDNNGNILDRDFFEAVIRSKKRFTYEEINAYLRGENSGFKEENSLLYDDLMDGFELAKILERRRLERGCINFEFGEVEAQKDSAGNVIGFKERERGPANDLIEEFMIAANEAVAQLFYELKHPFIYRTHGTPFPEKLENFLKVCRENGIDTSMVNVDEVDSKQLKNLLSKIEDKKLQKCINMHLITTMKQARYTKDYNPHFGLSSDYYCHFTSPIRRYPDLFIHRLLKKYIRKTINNDVTKALYEKSAETVAKHCCFTERNAQRAEEELDKLNVMQYMSRNPEVEYEALVYNITSNGLSVLVDGIVTGSIRLHNITTTDKASEILVNGESYKIGDVLKVTFKEYNVKNVKLFFEISER